MRVGNKIRGITGPSDSRWEEILAQGGGEGRGKGLVGFGWGAAAMFFFGGEAVRPLLRKTKETAHTEPAAKHRDLPQSPQLGVNAR